MNFSECQHQMKYFISIEDEVFDSDLYVSIEKENFPTFSVHYSKLLLMICSEIDMLLKKLCVMIDIDFQGSSLSEYYSVITKYYQFFKIEKVRVLYSTLEFAPWQDWMESKAPIWWSDYNKIKHRRLEIDNDGKSFFMRANLKNVLNALAALYILEQYIFYLNETNSSPGEDQDERSVTMHLLQSHKLIISDWVKCYEYFLSRDNAWVNMKKLRALMTSR